jgi:hypothetical protein
MRIGIDHTWPTVSGLQFALVLPYSTRSHKKLMDVIVPEADDATN